MPVMRARNRSARGVEISSSAAISDTIGSRPTHTPLAHVSRRVQALPSTQLSGVPARQVPPWQSSVPLQTRS